MLEASTSKPAFITCEAASYESAAVLWKRINISITPQSEYTYPRKPKVFRRISVSIKWEAEFGSRFHAL